MPTALTAGSELDRSTVKLAEGNLLDCSAADFDRMKDRKVELIWMVPIALVVAAGRSTAFAGAVNVAGVDWENGRGHC